MQDLKELLMFIAVIFVLLSIGFIIPIWLLVNFFKTHPFAVIFAIAFLWSCIGGVTWWAEN